MRLLLAWLRHLAIDISPLRESRDFRVLWTGQLISMVGSQITTVAVPFQVYQRTGSSLAVGTLGLVQLLPYIVMSLAGGSLADTYDRRKLMLISQIGLAISSGLLMVGAFAGHPPLIFLYAVAGLASALAAVALPARAAAVPNMVPRHLLATALSLNFALFQSTLIAGPALGGVVIARFGLPWGYAIDVVTFAASIAAALMLHPQPPQGARREPALRAIWGGLRFVWAEKAILGTFAADLDAMIFGMPRALFPAIALTVYNAGPAGLGLLYAAPGVGAVVGSLLSGFVGRMRHQGRAVLVSVAIWGAGIAVFGLATVSLLLAMAVLAVAGAADAISAIARGTILQTIAPDRLRGRLSATNSMVVVGGPYLGDFRAGAMATAVGPEAALVAGGAICVALCGLLALAFPALTGYDGTVENGGGPFVVEA